MNQEHQVVGTAVLEFPGQCPSHRATQLARWREFKEQGAQERRMQKRRPGRIKVSPWRRDSDCGMNLALKPDVKAQSVQKVLSYTKTFRQRY